MEKTKEADLIRILAGVVDKFGLKLVAKERTNPIPELPKNRKNYENMDSRKLSMELKEVQIDKQKLETIEQKVRADVSKFMNEQKENQYTASVFSQGKLNESKIVLNNHELHLISNLNIYVEDLMKQAIEAELTEKFVTLYPEHKGIVKNIAIRSNIGLGGESLLITVGDPGDRDNDKPGR
jgi:hypothetical protein